MQAPVIKFIKTTSSVILAAIICTAYTVESSDTNHEFLQLNRLAPQQTPKHKRSSKKSISRIEKTESKNLATDSTFTLRIENEKRVADEALKAKLVKEIKSAIAAHHLSKPYKIAMGFTRGARDVETFLFGEQIFYLLAEGGYSVNGKPLDMPEITPDPVPQIKVKERIIYVILSKM